MKKNNIITIITVFLLAIFVTAGSYAYFSWTSTTNKNIVFNTSKELEEYVNYNEGESSFVGDFQLSNSYLDGIHSTITMSKTTNDVLLYASIHMKIKSIGDTISKVPGLKWTVTSGDSVAPGNVLSNGNFLSVKTGDDLLLLPNISLTTTAQKYTVWIWLDENVDTSYLLSGETIDTGIWSQIDQIIEDRFEITSIGNNYQDIRATAINTSYNITHYAITNSNTTPSSWNTIPTADQGKIYNLSQLVSSSGTYYVWFKDNNNATTSKNITVSEVDVIAPTCTWDKFSTTPIKANDISTITLTCIDTGLGIGTGSLTKSDITLSNANVILSDNIVKKAITNGYTYTLTVTGSTNNGITSLTLPANKVKDRNNRGNSAITSEQISVYNSFTITYYDQGGNTFSGTHANGYPTTYTYGTTTQLDTPTKTGYTFSGYYTTSNCSGNAVTSISSTQHSNVTLYAKWLKKVQIPTCNSPLTYNGSQQTLINNSTEGYTLSNNTRTEAGSQNVTATLTTGYIWNDNSSTSKTISCSIGKYTPSITLSSASGTVPYSTEKTYNATPSTISTCTGTLTTTSGTTTNITITGGASISNAASGTAQTITYKGVGNTGSTSTLTTNYIPTNTTSCNNAPAKTFTATVSNNSIFGTLTITGTNETDNTLTAYTNEIMPNDATFTYKWYTNTSNSTSGGTLITGATSKTFTPTANELGKYIYVEVTASKTNYNSKTFEDITDAATNTVATVRTVWDLSKTAGTDNVKGILTANSTANTSQTLNISGTGAMKIFAEYADVPWVQYRNTITTLNINSGVTSIGDRAFYNFDGITSLSIPSGITYIGTYSLYNCNNLTGTLTIPATVSSMGSNPFLATPYTTYVVESGNTKYKVVNNVLLDYAGTKVISYPYGNTATSITVPSGVTIISYYAMYGMQATSVSLPNSLTSINSCAFQTSKLTSVTIPSGVTTISNSAFDLTSSLANAYIKSTSLSTVANNSFARMKSGSNIYVANSTVASKFTAGTQYTATNTTLNYPPTITTHPSNVSVTYPQTATFTVQTTAGIPNTTNYQWQYRTSSSGTWANVTESQGTVANNGTTSTFTTVATTVAMTGYQYRCIVSNTASNVLELTIASNSATLTVNKKTDTISLTEKTGTYTGNAFAATVSATSGTTVTLTYYSNNTCTTQTTTSNGTAAGGTPKNAGVYYATGTSVGNSNYSAGTLACTKAVTINQANNTISVTTPQTWSTTFSTSNQAKILSAATNGQGTVSYTIKSQVNSSSSTVTNFTISGTTLTMAGNTGAGTYTVVVTASATGNTNYKAESKDITVNVTVSKKADTITLTEKTATYTGNGFAATVSATSGTTVTLTYYSNNTCTTQTTTSNATSAGGTPKNAGVYYATGTSIGNNNYSAGTLNCTKAVTINQATPTLILANKTATYIGSAIAIDTPTVTGVTGGTTPNGAITYTYYTNNTCATTTSAHTNAGTYYAKASMAASGNYGSGTSNCATLTINNGGFSGGSVSITGTNKVGQILTATVTPPTPTPDTYNYKWYTNDTASTTGGTQISGATSSTLTLTTNQLGKYIYVEVTASKTSNYDSKTFKDITDATTNAYDVTKENIAPEIRMVTNSNTSYTKTKSVTINVTDNSAGLKTSQKVKYGWSTSNTTEPSTYTEVTLSNTAGATSTSFTATGSGYTGQYYLWVIPNASVCDMVNNCTTSIIKSTGLFYYDNTAPTLSLAKEGHVSGFKGWALSSGVSIDSNNILNISSSATSSIYSYYYSVNNNPWRYEFDFSTGNVSTQCPEIGCPHTGGAYFDSSFAPKVASNGDTANGFSSRNATALNAWTHAIWENGGNNIEYLRASINPNSEYTVPPTKYKNFTVYGDVYSKEDYTINLTINETTTIATKKYASGNQNTSYFQTNGTTITGNTFNVSANGTYTVYITDTAGNETVSTIAVSKIDKTAPVMDSITATYTSTGGTIIAKATDNGSGIVAYAFTSNENEPTSWTRVNNTTSQVTETYSITSGGTYYAWFVDGAQNVNHTSIIGKDVIVAPTNSLCVSRTYNGSAQQLTSVTSGTGYTLSGYSQTNANESGYTITATLSSGYIWSDNSTGTKTFTCPLLKATPTLTLNGTSGTVVIDKTMTFTETANIAGSFGNVSGTTSKATVSPASYSAIAANTAKTVTVTGVAAGSSTITVTFTPTDTTNYKTTTKTYAATITSSATIPTNSLCVSRTYNGSAQQLTSATSGTGYTLSGYSQTNANESGYTITATLSSGYRWSDNSTGTKTFTCPLLKATPTLTLNGTSGTVVIGKTMTFTETANIAGSFGNVSGTTSKATVSPASYSAIAANTAKTVTVTGVAAGSSTITVTFTPTDTTNYKTTTKTYAATIAGTVTYNATANGGTFGSISGYTSTATVNYNSVIDLSVTNRYGTKTGYTFVGWNTNQNATSALTSLNMGTSNVTLYAIYQISQHTLTINPNSGIWNGTTNATTITQNYNTSYNVQNNAIKAGYVFDGWKLTSGTGDMTWYSENDLQNKYYINSLNAPIPNLYNNSGGGTVVFENVEDNDSPTGYAMRIVTNGKAAPHAGGFVHVTTALPGTAYYHKIIAKVPQGYSLMIYSNKIGIGSQQYWLTSNEGTGNYETYEYVTYSGYNGKITSWSLGFIVAGVNLTVPDVTNTNVTWYVLESSIYKVANNLTELQETSIGFKFVDSNATLTAQWNASGAKLTYNLQGGSYGDGTIGTSWTDEIYKDMVYNTTYSSTKNVPYYISDTDFTIYKTGYTFGGWYTAASGGTQLFNTAGQLNANVTGYSNASRVWQYYTSDINIYARWIPNAYTLTLNKNTGTNDGTTTIYEKYGTGVYLESALTNAMTGSANPIVKPVKSYAITYNDNSQGATYTASPATSNATFNGYYTATSDGTQMIQASGYINTTNFTNTKYTSNTTLYAQWTNTSITLPEISKTGYTCKWAEGSASGTQYLGGASRPISANTAYYAVCNDTSAPTNAKIETTSTLKSASQTATLSCSDNIGVTSYYYGTTAPTISSTYTNITSITSFSTTKSITAAGTYYLACKDAAGNTSSTASKTYNSYNVNNVLETVAGTTGTYTNANYASTSNATYIAPNGTSITLANVYSIPTGSSAGNFKGYSQSFTTSATTLSTTAPTLSSNTTYYMWFNRNTYALTLNKGTGISNVTGAGTHKYGKVVNIGATPTEGYTFASWAKNSGNDPASATTASTTVTITQSTTLTANASVSSYTITLNKNGGTTDGTTSIYEKYATGIYLNSTLTNAMTGSANPITKPVKTYSISYNDNSQDATYTASPTTSNVTFNGFYTTTSDGMQMIQASGYINPTNFTNTKFTANTTLYAQWTNTSITLPTITKVGYSCKWAEGSASGTQYAGGASRPISANTTYYAICIVRDYTVTYNYSENGGESSTKASETLGYGSNVDLTPTSVKTGWTFVGWNITKTAQTALTSLTVSDDDIILYAIYRKEAITLTSKWNANGATLSNINDITCQIPAVYNNATQATSCTLTAPTITRSGFLIVGYNTDKDATTSTLASAGTLSLNNDNNNSTWYAITKKTVTATYDGNGATSGSTGSNSCTIKNTATSCMLNLSPPGFEKPGYNYAAWAQGSVSGPQIPSITPVELTNNETFYAIWVDNILPTGTAKLSLNNGIYTLSLINPSDLGSGLTGTYGYALSTSNTCTGATYTNYTQTSVVYDDTYQSGTIYYGCIKLTDNDGNIKNLISAGLTYYNQENSWLTHGSYSYTVPATGIYKIELWGANGGKAICDGTECNINAPGGYTSGKITLIKNNVLYLNIGGSGANAQDGIVSEGGYNGGGSGSTSTSTSGGGGGASDIRYGGTSLNDRIMVAGGGGGASGTSTPGAAGGLSGYSLFSVAPAGTQTSGYSFGVGQSGSGTAGGTGVAGGGGGYWGGSNSNTSNQSSGSGGSSYISGHTGSVAVVSSISTSARTGTSNATCQTGTSDNLCSIHYSRKSFSDTLMIDGAGYTWTNVKAGTVGTNLMPNPNGGNFASGIGNIGDGSVRITYLGVETLLLTYDNNGGSGCTSTSIIPGTQYGAMCNPSKSGFSFVGWYTSKTGGDRIEETNTVIVSTNQTLYAHWESAEKPVIAVNPGQSEIYSKNAAVTINVTKGSYDLDHSSFRYRWSLNQTDEANISFVNGATVQTGSITGPYYLIVKACDSEATCTNQVYGPYNVDNNAPSGNIIATVNNGVLTAIANINDNASGIKEYGYLIQQSDTCPASGYIPTNNLSYTFNLELNNTYYVCMKVIDNAGNVAIIRSNGGHYYEETHTEAGNYNYTVPATGIYEIQAWGAEGAPLNSTGGKGGYTSGKVLLNENDILHFYVGGAGSNTSSSSTINGGYNGGGTAKKSSTDGSSGGGASDVRYGGTQPVDRIMVAGGGGGASLVASTIQQPGHAGGIKSVNAKGASGQTTLTANGASQITSGSSVFYQGVSGGTSYSVGGGGGYYGGQLATLLTATVASGGSSYISGHTGCVAVESDGTAKSGCTAETADTSCSIHYSNKEFMDTVMIDGEGYSWSNTKNGFKSMPTPAGGTYETGVGKTGDGAIKIRFITLNSITLTYDNNGGSGCISKSVITADNFGTMCSPVKEGYDFDGWYTEAEGGTEITPDDMITSTTNFTIYAHWTNQLSYNELSANYWCSNTHTASSTDSAIIYYTGNCQIDGSTSEIKVKLLTSGIFKMNRGASIDVFLVGGGGGGGNSTTLGSGGGGGYTSTVSGIQISEFHTYEITIGSGGAIGEIGESTEAFGNIVIGGNPGLSGKAVAGGSGGSGGGGGPNTTSQVGGNGGSYGGGGNKGEGLSAILCWVGLCAGGEGGVGQGSTTCEFGEGTTSSCNTGYSAYAGGGGGSGEMNTGILAQFGLNGTAGGNTPNTGGGGKSGETGGSGIVIIRRHGAS